MTALDSIRRSRPLFVEGWPIIPARETSEGRDMPITSREIPCQRCGDIRGRYVCCEAGLEVGCMVCVHLVQAYVLASERHIRLSPRFFEIASAAVKTGPYDRAIAEVVCWLCVNQDTARASQEEWAEVLAAVARLWNEAHACIEPRT